MSKKAFKIGSSCRTCGKTVTDENCVISGFHLRNHCRECWEIKAKEYNAKRNMVHYNLKARHNMTPEEYKKKLDLQLNGCAVCKQPCKTGRNLAIDHDHKTNVIRDLLCQRCNVILGLVNDDEFLLFQLMDYLKRHQEVAS